MGVLNTGHIKSNTEPDIWSISTAQQQPLRYSWLVLHGQVGPFVSAFGSAALTADPRGPVLPYALAASLASSNVLSYQFMTSRRISNLAPQSYACCSLPPIR
jgi:hypothetical protein